MNVLSPVVLNLVTTTLKIQLSTHFKNFIARARERPNFEDPSINPLENLLARARERPKCKDNSVSYFVKRTVGSSAEDLKTNNSR